MVGWVKEEEEGVIISGGECNCGVTHNKDQLMSPRHLCLSILNHV